MPIEFSTPEAQHFRRFFWSPASMNRQPPQPFGVMLYSTAN
jgi:hypothetical protein